MSDAKNKYILTERRGRVWAVIARFKTEQELIDAIGSNPNLRGRAGARRLKWVHYEPQQSLPIAA